MGTIRTQSHVEAPVMSGWKCPCTTDICEVALVLYTTHISHVSTELTINDTRTASIPDVDRRLHKLMHHPKMVYFCLLKGRSKYQM